MVTSDENDILNYFPGLEDLRWGRELSLRRPRDRRPRSPRPRQRVSKMKSSRKAGGRRLEGRPPRRKEKKGNKKGTEQKYEITLFREKCVVAKGAKLWSWSLPLCSYKTRK